MTTSFRHALSAQLTVGQPCNTLLATPRQSSIRLSVMKSDYKAGTKRPQQVRWRSLVSALALRARGTHDVGAFLPADLPFVQVATLATPD